MYKMATQIANTYAADLYNSETSLETVHGELTSLSMYMDGSPIWIVNPSGRLVLDSARLLGPADEVVIEGFDPTVTGSSYYTTGTFWGSFGRDAECLCAYHGQLQGSGLCCHPHFGSRDPGKSQHLP